MRRSDTSTCRRRGSLARMKKTCPFPTGPILAIHGYPVGCRHDLDMNQLPTETGVVESWPCETPHR